MYGQVWRRLAQPLLTSRNFSNRRIAPPPGNETALTYKVGAVCAGLCGGGVALDAYTTDEGGSVLRLANWEGAARPVLGTLLPADAYIFLYSFFRADFLEALALSVTRVQNRSERSVLEEFNSRGWDDGVSSSTRAMGLSFRNDLGNAAGLDKDGSLLEFNYQLGAGSKTLLCCVAIGVAGRYAPLASLAGS